VLKLRTRTDFEYLVAFVGGTAILVLPVLLDQDPLRVRHSNALIPWIHESIAGLKLYSLALLIPFGIALGVWAKGSAIHLAISAIALFPLYSILDIAVRGLANHIGHSILAPHYTVILEWLFYGMLVLFPLLGIVLGRFMRRKLAART
jgi:hypothetical protein